MQGGMLSIKKIYLTKMLLKLKWLVKWVGKRECQEINLEVHVVTLEVHVVYIH